MVDVAMSAARLFGAFLLVLLNGFFVASEFAYVRIRATAVETFVDEGRSGATLLQEAMENLDDYLAVTQLGITISSLGLGWIGEPAVAALLEPILAPVIPEGGVHLVSFAVGFGVITFLHVVFGELAPKTIAIARAETVALLVAAPMKAFYYLFVPGIVVFNGTANFFTKAIGIPPASESEETLSEEELLAVLSQSGRAGHIDAEEVEMIEHVFALDDVPVREVMVPRPDAVSVTPDTSVSDLRSLIAAEGHTRYPVVAGDDVEGYVDVKDLLAATDEGSRPDRTTAGELGREMPVVPETARVTELLSTLQAQNSPMAGVIDEWGAFAGIVTVEDVVEVVVGDIRDEFDVDAREPSIERRGDGTFLADGSVSVSMVNEVLDADFQVEGVGTVGGLVLARLGRAPEAGDRIEIDEYVLEVETVDGARITELAIGERSSDG
ncbi:MAG: hemolysin family protein [Haloferacaceae archaeon]